MSEVYAFLFCIALGTVSRFLYIAGTMLAKRTDILPVTVIIDIGMCLAVGGCFTAYVILAGAVLAPYMFAALGSGYFITYRLTRR